MVEPLITGITCLRSHELRLFHLVNAYVGSPPGGTTVYQAPDIISVRFEPMPVVLRPDKLAAGEPPPIVGDDSMPAREVFPHGSEDVSIAITSPLASVPGERAEPAASRRQYG